MDLERDENFGYDADDMNIESDRQAPNKVPDSSTLGANIFSPPSDGMNDENGEGVNPYGKNDDGDDRSPNNNLYANNRDSTFSGLNAKVEDFDAVLRT